MARMQKAVLEVAEKARHVLVRNVPRSCTSGDLRRAIMQADIKGVASVDLLYTHFRPTGKALLTMSLSDYTDAAIQNLQDLTVAGSCVSGEAVYNVWSSVVRGDAIAGDGPSAGHEAGKTVTLSGLPGRFSITEVYRLLQGFDVKKVTIVPMPEKKFSLYSRFAVQVNSKSEAHRIVRRFHMTEFHKLDSAPPLRAEIVY